MKELLRLTLSRAALLPLSLLALSCGGGTTKPPQKDPPQATLSVPKPNVAGPKITVNVGATGCDAIQTLQIFDRDDLLKTVPYSGPGTVPVDLAVNEVKYTRGIAVQMSLKARVTCTDGRSNDSQPQPATFFPAAEVIDPPPTGGQVVTDNFVTEGTLPLIYFIGCGNAVGGFPKLYKVEKNNTSTQEPLSVNMPFICTQSTVITPKHPATGKRWVWTPDAGAMAIDANLNITGQVLAPIDLLVVGADGDAIVYDAGSGGAIVGVARVSHVNGTVKWSRSPDGLLINAPAASTNEVMVASITANNAPSGRANILVTRLDYANGAPLGVATVLQVASDNPIPSTAPPTVFSPNGDLLFVASTGIGGITTVLACLTNANNCSPNSQRWTTSPVLSAPLAALVPYAAGSRVAAVASQQVWFLDASTGAVTNKGGLDGALSPEGGLVVLQVQPGAPPYPQSFYILTGPPPQQNLPAPQPLEIIATDDPTKGELYRYQINAGSLSVALDDSGTLWMRAGGSLVRPLSLGDYRQVRPVTP